MVALLIRMRWAIARNRMNASRAVLAVIAVVVTAVAALGSAAVGLATFERDGAATDMLALTATTWGLLWLVSPMLFGAMDATLRPAYFALLPLPPRRLSRALLAVSLVGVMPALAVVALAGPAVHAASRTPSALVVAVPAVVLAALLTVLAARLLTAALTTLTTSRRGRDLAMLATVLVGALVWLGYLALQFVLPPLLAGDLPLLSSVLRHNPYGWAASATEAAAQGSWLVAAAWLGALAVVVLALVAGWFPLVRRDLVEPLRPTTARRATRRKRRLALLPDTPVGAVAAKELAMYRRDARRQAALLMVPMFLLMGLVGPFVADGLAAYAAIGLYALAFGAIVGAANLYGLDGGSMWMVVAAPGGARGDVRGKQLAWLLLAAPVLVLFAAARYLLFDRGVEALAFDVATVVALLGFGAGAVAFTSTHAAYAVSSAKQGNPFSTRGSFNVQSLGALLLVLVGTVVVGLVSWAPSTLPGVWSWLAVPAGAAVGYGGWRWGTWLSVRRLAARGPEVLAVVRKEP